jgi:hypothetical protein
MLALSGAAPVSQPPVIGAATNIDNMVTGVVAGQEQPLRVGTSVFQMETVRTNASSKAQLVFLDRTGLSIGPESEVNLDRFVYDPNRSAGEVVLELGVGTFRFITGSQDKRNYRINTAIATIGVRGTIFHCLNDLVHLVCVVEEGQITITLPNGTAIELNQVGFGVDVRANGTFTPPTLWTAGTAGDPFNVGWQQFAINTDLQTGAIPNTGGPGNNNIVQVSSVTSTIPSTSSSPH